MDVVRNLLIFGVASEDANPRNGYNKRWSKSVLQKNFSNGFGKILKARSRVTPAYFLGRDAEVHAVSGNGADSSPFNSNYVPNVSTTEITPTLPLPEICQDAFPSSELALLTCDPVDERELPNLLTSPDPVGLIDSKHQLEQYGLDQNVVVDFPIVRCIREYERLGSNSAYLMVVGDIFKNPQNRESFLSIQDDAKLYWLKEKISEACRK